MKLSYRTVVVIVSVSLSCMLANTHAQPQGRLLVSGPIALGQDHQVQEFDLSTRQRTVLAEFPEPAGALAVCPDGLLYVATYGAAGRIYALEPNCGAILHSFPSPFSGSAVMACMPSGKLLIYDDANPSVIEELSPDGASRQVWASGFSVVSRLVRSITITPSGTVAFVLGHPFLSSTTSMVEYDLQGNYLRDIIQSTTDRMDYLLFSSDVEVLAAHRDSRCIKRYDWTTTPATFLGDFACDATRLGAMQITRDRASGTVIARDHESGCLWGWDSAGELLYGGEALVCYGRFLGGAWVLMLPDENKPPIDERSAKNRFLSFSAGDAGASQAIRVTFVDLPAPFDEWNGAMLWVGPPSEVSEHGAKVLPVAGFDNFTAATLQCDGPVYMDLGALGVVHVFHEGIVPGGIYDIQVVNESCDVANESGYSAPLVMTQSIHGDIVGLFDDDLGLWTAPNGNVDVAFDVVALLDKFSSISTAPIKARADLEGPDGCVDLRINITDVVQALNAFAGVTYPFSPSAADACNSTCPNVLP